MTEAQPTELPPCTRGCTCPADGDEPAKPKPATHGQLCASDFYRITAALESVPDLIANMRAQLARQSAAGYSERVSGSSNDGTPVPLRIDVLDASDSLYAKLVSWTEVYAGELHTTQPHAAVWINFKEVQGMRPVNTPDDARALAAELAGWFLDRLDELCASEANAVMFHDDLCYGWDDALGVFPLASRYGVEPRPPMPSAPRECPVCGSEGVFVKWPDKLDSELAVMCARCRHIIDPDTVNRYAIATRVMQAAEPLTVVIETWSQLLEHFPLEETCTCPRSEDGVACTGVESIGDFKPGRNCLYCSQLTEEPCPGDTITYPDLEGATA